MAYLLGGLIIAYTASKGAVDLPLVGVVKPWQLVFFYIGFPGLLIALLMFTIKEPLRRNLDGSIKTEPQKAPPIKVVFQHLKQHARTYLLINLGIGIWSILTYGGGAWMPSFLTRTYGYTIQEAAFVIGIMLLVCSTSGVFFGGWLADRFLKKGYKDAKVRVIAICIALSLPTGIIYPIFDNQTVMFIFLASYLFLTKAPIGVAAAAIQEITPNEMRGQASALYLFTLNLIGLGLGPTLVALLTDFTFKDEAMLRYSLLIVGVTASIFAAFCFYLSMKPYRETIEKLSRVEQEG